MSFGLGYNEHESEQQSSSGLFKPQRTYFSNISPKEFGYARGRALEAEQDPGGLQYQSVVDRLLPMGRYGLPAGSEAGVYQLGRDLFSRASGSRAQRGFTNPQNLEAVLGDSLRMASGQLIPQATQVALQRAQMAPALRQAAFGYGTAPLQFLQQLLSGSSEGTGSSSGFGFNTQMSSSGGSGGGPPKAIV